jgi:hypothetical protein
MSSNRALSQERFRSGELSTDGRREPFSLAAGLFVLCAVALAGPWLSGRYTIPWDSKAHFFPQFAFLAHALHSGQSPFWTPNVFAGMPQIADPQSLIFAPFFFAAAALTPEPSFALEDAIIFAMLGMGGLALIAWFRDLGWSAAGALLAALAFAFGGSAAWRIQHTGQIMSLAWLPPTLWLLERALDRRSVAWGAAAGAVAAFLVLGRDQVAFLGVLFLAAYALFRVATDVRPWRGAVAPLGAGAFVGTLIIAAPLAFTLDLARNSNRPAIDLDGAHKGSLPPAALLTLVSANIFGTDGPLSAFWGPPSAAFGTKDIFLARNMTDIYVGALALVATLAAFGRRFIAPPRIRFFVAAAILFALYALGRYTPAFAILYHIPCVDLWRRPADATFLFCTMLAVLAGYGLTLIERGDVRPRGATLAGALLVLFGVASAVAVERGRFAQALAPLTVSFGFVVGAVALLWSAREGWLGGARLVAAVALFVGVDLAVNNGPNESTALPPAQFDVLRVDTREPVIAFLRARLAENAAPDRRDRVELAAIDFHWPNATLVHGLDHDLGYNPVRLKVLEDATGAGDHLALPEQRIFSRLYPKYRSPLSDMLGLRYLVTGVPVEEIDRNYQPGDFNAIGRIGRTYVYENRGAFARAQVVTCAMQVDFARMIETGEWPEADYRETVLLEEPPLCHTHRGLPPDAARARILAYGNDSIDIATSAPPGGGWLVLNDVWQPWWYATVDDVETPVLRANVMFRAVAIPEGVHEVRFRFRPFRGLLTGFGSAAAR